MSHFQAYGTLGPRGQALIPKGIAFRIFRCIGPPQKALKARLFNGIEYLFSQLRAIDAFLTQLRLVVENNPSGAKLCAHQVIKHPAKLSDGYHALPIANHDGFSAKVAYWYT
jgi:hypothetical protein